MPSHPAELRAANTNLLRRAILALNGFVDFDRLARAAHGRELFGRITSRTRCDINQAVLYDTPSVRCS
jgi:hypothetical protein